MLSQNCKDVQNECITRDYQAQPLPLIYLLHFKKYIYKSQSLSLKTLHYQVWNTLLNYVQPFATTMHNRTVAAQDSIQKFRFNFTVPVQNAVNDMNIINDYQQISTAASPETHKETQKHCCV